MEAEAESKTHAQGLKRYCKLSLQAGKRFRPAKRNTSAGTGQAKLRSLSLNGSSESGIFTAFSVTGLCETINKGPPLLPKVSHSTYPVWITK